MSEMTKEQCLLGACKKMAALAENSINYQSQARFEACLAYAQQALKLGRFFVWNGGNIRKRKPGPACSAGLQANSIVLRTTKIMFNHHFSEAADSLFTDWVASGAVPCVGEDR